MGLRPGGALAFRAERIVGARDLAAGACTPTSSRARSRARR
jgi:hypothetical protein